MVTKGQATEPATKADLLALEVGLSDRFTVIMASINGLHERMTAHDSAHVVADKQETVKEEVKLDARKAGIASLVAAVGAAVAVVIRVLVTGGV